MVSPAVSTSLLVLARGKFEFDRRSKGPGPIYVSREQQTVSVK
jgi:hypothetical protein